MKNCWLSIAVVFGLTLPVFAADKVQPVRMGCGIMTFDTVPGWGLGEDGKSVLGSTHGGVVLRGSTLQVGTRRPESSQMPLASKKYRFASRSPARRLQHCDT